jgi:hypothetical protein
VNSSALARREPLLAAGGFAEQSWARGIEDYGAWLAMADRGARFLVLGEPWVRYTSHGDERFSGGAPLRVDVAIARLAWLRAARRPRDRALLRAALGRTAAAARRAVG